MNNKLCPNCGREIVQDASFCTNCGTQLSQTNNEVNNTNTIQNVPINEQLVNNQVGTQQNTNNTNTVTNNNDESNATSLGVLSLVLYFGGGALLELPLDSLPDSVRNFISAFSGFFSLAGIVLMIVGRVKYPNNKFLKVVMWIIIVVTVLGLIAFILLFIWCYITCSNMDTSGCG